MKMKWMLLRGLLGVVISIGIVSVQPSVTYAGGRGMTSPLKSSSQYQYTDQLIVKYRDMSVARATVLKKEHVDALSATAGVALTHFRAMSGDAHVFKLPHRMTMTEVEALVRKLKADPSVEYAEPDRRMFPMLVPNDPEYAYQWHYKSPDAPDNEKGGVSLPGAWAITTGSTSVVVAVIDTGLRPHADIDSNILDGTGRIVPGYDFINNSLVANDLDGRDSDPTDPGDWITVAENAGTDSTGGYFAGCEVSDSSWHGTHVAGTIGALSNNGSGVAGINWASKILLIRVLGKCGGYLSDVADGIRWAAGLTVSGVPANANPAKVLNLSLGTPVACSSTTDIQRAIDDVVAAGAIVVVAAGNNNDTAENSSPASCNGVISVAAVNRDGGRAYYSNFGTAVKIAAPGGEQFYSGDSNGILSTLNAGSTSPGADNYEYYQGTSMATPHVSGIVSLLLSVDPSLTPGQVLTLIQSTARAFPTGTGSYGGDCTTALCGAGIVNAYPAVYAAYLGVTPVPLGDAVDNASLSWATEGNTGWIGQDAVSYFGGSAARSGFIGNSQTSSISTTVTLAAPGTLSFFWKVSSQAFYDVLKFSINGTQKASIGGEKNWAQKTYSLGAGTNTLSWTYSKNTTNSAGMDAAWLDKVEISPYTKVTVVSPNGGETFHPGDATTITWTTPAAAQTFKVSYTTNGLTYIPIATGLTGTSYDWTVPLTSGNMTTCKVKVESYNAANASAGLDTSDAPFTIEVLKVNYPNGTESLSSNALANINYTITGLTAASATFSYTLDGLTWKTIDTLTATLTPNTYDHPWTVPVVTAVKTKCKVKVVLKDVAGTVIATDISDAVFTVSP